MRFNLLHLSVAAIVTLLAGCEKKPQDFQPQAPQLRVQDSTAKIQEPNLAQTPEEITLAAQGLVSAIKGKSPEVLDSITGKSGIVLIRNFTSGTNGARGENVRSFNSAPIVQISFPVSHETPIDVTSLFPDLTQENLKQIPVFKTSVTGLDIQDSPSEVKPETRIILDALSKATLPHSDVKTPFGVQVDDDVLVIAESDGVDNVCTGNFAIFKKLSGSYRLRALLDLR
jgi:hypothetical protein